MSNETKVDRFLEEEMRRREREEEAFNRHLEELEDVKRHRRAIEESGRGHVRNGEVFNEQHAEAVRDGRRMADALERIAAALERLAEKEPTP